MSDLPLVLDLFSGTGSATQPFVECGKHRVVRVDIAGKPDIRADVRRLPIDPNVRPEFIWASPPCTEFSPITWSAVGRGFRGPPEPNGPLGMGLVRAAFAYVKATGARYAIENVAGSVPFISREFGRPKLGWAGRWIWSSEEFPVFMPDPIPHRKTYGHDDTLNERGKKVSHAEGQRIRSMIPRPLAEAAHRAVCEETPR